MATKGRILVVDDDRLVLATVTNGLAQAGFEVIDADNGDEAILLARQQRPDLALLDIRMEGKSGFDVAEYLRDVTRTPFMFLSAFADEPTRAKVAELGAVAYLVKPLEVGQIVPQVQAALDRVRDGAAAAGAPPAAAAPAPGLPAASAAGPLADPVPLALGVLMHRHSLPRDASLQRLREMARKQGVGEREQAERLLAAIEELARS